MSTHARFAELECFKRPVRRFDEPQVRHALACVGRALGLLEVEHPRRWPSPRRAPRTPSRERGFSGDVAEVRPHAARADPACAPRSASPTAWLEVRPATLAARRDDHVSSPRCSSGSKMDRIQPPTPGLHARDRTGGFVTDVRTRGSEPRGNLRVAVSDTPLIARNGVAGTRAGRDERVILREACAVDDLCAEHRWWSRGRRRSGRHVLVGGPDARSPRARGC